MREGIKLNKSQLIYNQYKQKFCAFHTKLNIAKFQIILI